MMVKVCGITSREDAEAAVRAGASALGFNFYLRSPRYIEPRRAGEIGHGLAVLKVGVFVNEPRGHVERIAAEAGLDIAQLHGDEAPESYPHGIAVWKAARVNAEFDLSKWEFCPAEALLLDGPADLLYGGAGISFDWRIAAASGRRIILAGGLDGANVARAIEQARPWGVDACSRIERAPGIKDHGKMTDFIAAARAAFAC